MLPIIYRGILFGLTVRILAFAVTVLFSDFQQEKRQTGSFLYSRRASRKVSPPFQTTGTAARTEHICEVCYCFSSFSPRIASGTNVLGLSAEGCRMIYSPDRSGDPFDEGRFIFNITFNIVRVFFRSLFFYKRIFSHSIGMCPKVISKCDVSFQLR